MWRNNSYYADSSDKVLGRVYTPDGAGRSWTGHVWGGGQRNFKTSQEAKSWVEANA